MSLPELIYWAEVAERVGNTALFFVLIFGFIGLVAIRISAEADEYKYVWIAISAYVVLELIFIAGVIFIPSKQTIYLMAGAKYSTEIAQSAEAKEVGSKILKVLNQKLDEMGKK